MGGADYNFGDRIFRRSQEGYETARGNAVWRANKPNRYPEAIVLARSEQDVQAAVRLARAEGLQVATRSGGHSWVSPHIRDGSVLIDLSGMSDLQIDAEARTFWVDPSVKGRRVNDELGKFGLMCPTGHHNTVGCGGFLLCGGFGWNFRQWGNGCTNVRAIRLVTAAGDIIDADENTNADYFWAARGGGPGFFGVVTKFKVGAFARPKVFRSNGYVFPVEATEEVAVWFHTMCREAPVYVELVNSAMSWNDDGSWAPTRTVFSGLTFANSDEEALRVKKLFDACPIQHHATTRRDNAPTTLEERYVGATAVDPQGYRYAADNIYTDSDPVAVSAATAKLYKTLPTPYSHAFWLYQGERPAALANMALSAWGEVYMAAYSIWSDPAEDQAMMRYPVEQMRALDPIANGEGQMNDENMAARPIRYLSQDAENKLAALRSKYDPDNLFVGFLRKH